MKWTQRFERARKKGTFTRADAKAAGSERHSPFGERAYDMGYRHSSHCHPQLFRAVYAFDWELTQKIDTFQYKINDGIRDDWWDKDADFGLNLKEAEAAYNEIIEHDPSDELMSRIEYQIEYLCRFAV